VSGSELAAGIDAIPYPPFPTFLTLEDDDVVLDARWVELTNVVKHRALRTGNWKLYYTPTRDGARYSLYDLATDPEEQRDVAAANTLVVAVLREKLIAWMTQDGSVVRPDGIVAPRDFEMPH
jgi:hypothetical protein